MSAPLRRVAAAALALLLVPALAADAAFRATLPDGRAVAPYGFTIPIDGFAPAFARSPDARWLAVVLQNTAVEIVDLARSTVVDRLAIPQATSIAWTSDGLYVTRGYAGIVARYRFESSPRAVSFTKDVDLVIGGGGLLIGIAEDPATKRLAVARTAARELVVVDDETGRELARRSVDGQPFAVAFASNAVVATLYDGDRVVVWRNGGDASSVITGPHPTQLLVDGDRAYVSNADGRDIAVVDLAAARLARRIDLSAYPGAPPGQTPAGTAISDDKTTLFVAESGYNDVAVVDLAAGRVRGRIPTGWYPIGVASAHRAPVPGKDARARDQLWVVSAKGWGSQADPGGEWDGTYTALVQHLVVPADLHGFSADVARNDRWNAHVAQPLPPIRHVVFIVRENKHFDEEFGDEPQAASDPSLVVFGRRYTPNAHALAERYTLFDNFMTDGEASIYGHSWTTQGMANDYLERNARIGEPRDADAAVAVSIWPYPLGGEAAVPAAELNGDWFRDRADLPHQPRVDVAPVFGPRGELIDELQRKHRSFRVYGEQMTVLPDGRIAPGLAEHADRTYPGAHIDYTTLDTDRARLFLADLAQHGLGDYTYITLPTDHTAGTRPGFYTPASYVANNDLALGQIVAGLARRPEWRTTLVIVTCDDAQGTGDHLDAHRMPAFALGPYVRRGYVDHTRYDQSSVLRTVEVLFGLNPLNVHDAAATPMLDLFAAQPDLAVPAVLPMNVVMERNPGVPQRTSFTLDAADAPEIAREARIATH